jgi:hypothetical protein
MAALDPNLQKLFACLQVSFPNLWAELWAITNHLIHLLLPQLTANSANDPESQILEKSRLPASEWQGLR